MQTADDRALLRQFVETQSDEAFAALVARHINLVYSVALRQTGQPQHAEEITQAVFIILAKKAAGLRHAQALTSWLFQTTRLTANNFVRSELRRRNREQEAYMQTVLDESAQDIWPRIAPLLDNAVGSLREKDRRAVLLRFYEGRNLREVGEMLGASEDAAEKRMSRALEKLRNYFAKRGVDSTAAAIGETISANSILVAPATLAKVATTAALAKGATTSFSTLTLVKGALKVMAWTKAKMAIVIGAGVVLAAGTATVTVREIESHGTLSIRMHVDGSDFVRVSGNQLWLEHAFYVTPENPIYVNGRPWSPTWAGGVSTKYTGLKPAFNPRHPEKIQLAVTAGRGPVSIAHLPAPDNNQTLSVLIDDNDYDGADWYEFTVSW